MRFVFDNMEDFISNIPVGTNIEVLFFNGISYGEFLESNEKEIKIKMTSRIKTIDKWAINTITILDKLKLVKE